MRQTGGGNTLDFFYDESGHPYALTHNGTTYYYVTNLQGDVLHIVNNAGTAVVSYTYDPYGKVLSATGTLAEVNPLRYRGYVYDSETGFYYLQSRYYDPTICRFINADSYVSTGQGFLGHNMFSYCRNNPASRKDTLGTTDEANPDDNTDLLDERKTYEGGQGIKSDLSNSPGKGGRNGGNNPKPLPKDKIKLEVDEALELAEDYLGQGYREVAPGRFVSLDGMRQIRMGPNDLLGMHGGGPHINFDRLVPSYKTSHIYF